MKEDRVIRFLNKLEDNISYEAIENDVKTLNYRKAFEDTHSLKGVALNLGLTELACASSDLCEAYRNGKPGVDVFPMLEELKVCYEKTLKVISQLEV